MKKHWLQHCIRAIATKAVNERSVHLINFSGGGQVIALKSATALILDRCATYKTTKFENTNNTISCNIFDKL